MIKKLVPVLFLVVGIGAGVGAGLMLSPDKSPAEISDEKHSDQKETEPKKDKAKSEKPKKSGEKDKDGAFEYLKITKQFVVPVVEEDRISALVTMSLSLEAKPGYSETFYSLEPKLRDGFLQVLFDHANIGGFDGAFTQSDNLSVLRKSLLEVARKDMGDNVHRVLIMSVSRQDT